eukprot:2694221-Amphidinium_carterae.1
MAYVQEQSDVINNMLNMLDADSPTYTPVASPVENPQQVDSDSSPQQSPQQSPLDDLEIPNFMEKSVQEALDILMVDSDAVVEFAPDTLHTWWAFDSEHTNYSVFAPQWLEV